MRHILYIFLFWTLHTSAVLPPLTQCPFCPPSHRKVINIAMHLRSHKNIIQGDVAHENITILEKTPLNVTFTCSEIENTFILEQCKYNCNSYVIYSSYSKRTAMEDHETICSKKKMSLEYILNPEKKA